MIRHAKQSAHEKFLGENPTSRSIYRSFKVFKKKSNDPTLPDPEKPTEYFATIGPLLSSKITMQHIDTKMDGIVNNVVLLNANETEVTKNIKLMRNKTVVAMI